MKLSAVGTDANPLVSENAITMYVGEEKTLEVRTDNFEFYNSDPSVISATRGGGSTVSGGGEVSRNSNPPSAEILYFDSSYSSSTGNLQLKALSAGSTIITLTDNDSGRNTPVTVTVTDSSTAENPAEAIDLGLPSGTLWASWNVGATKPEEVGAYYAWGETERKNNYEWSYYQHCSGGKDALYDIGSNISNTQYDAASVKWGDGWRMPTLTQWKEVIAYCTMTKTTLNGIDGVKLVSRNNGNSIFLPATGCRWDTGTYYADDVYCWLADLASAGSATAYYLTIQGNGMGYGRDHERYVGMPIRPVRPTQN